MGIFLRKLYNQKPLRWGSFQDVQYAIRRNMESIYKCNPDNEVLTMPLFWGLPCLDFSGNNNHGTNHGAQYQDKSLGFDGDKYVNISHSSSIDIGASDITLIVWFKTTNLVDGSRLFNKGGINRYELYYNLSDSGFIFAVDDNSAKSDTTPIAGAACADNNSHYIVAQRIYGDIIRGRIDNGNWISGPDYTGNISNTVDAQIGTNNHYGTSHWDGSIDDIHVFNVAHTSEITDIFYERPWDLYRRVSRPIYFLPSVTDWTGKFTGITNPAKINGVAVANISKVMGVS